MSPSMKALSIILHLATLIILGISLSFWRQTTTILMEKAAILESREKLTGFYSGHASGDSNTLESEQIQQSIERLAKRAPNDPALHNLRNLRATISDLKNKYDYPESPTLETHILSQEMTIRSALESNKALNGDKIKLQSELDQSKAQLASTFNELGNTKQKITRLEVELSDIHQKHAQFKDDYLKDFKRKEQEKVDLRNQLKNEHAGLILQNQELEAQNQELSMQVRRLDVKLARLNYLSRNQKSETRPRDNPGGNNVPEDDKMLPSRLFSGKVPISGINLETDLVLIPAGTENGIRKGMRLKLRKGKSTVIELGVVRVEPKYSLLKIHETKTWDQGENLRSLRRGDMVSLSEFEQDR